MVSNYMFRGLTQTKNHAAVQGGIDFEHDSGFSLGTWASTVDFGALEDANGNAIDRPSYEWDIYAGFGKTVGDFSYNVKLSYYAYPDQNADNWNFSDIAVSGTWKMLTVGMAYILDGEASTGYPYREGDLYYYGSLSFDLPMGITLGGTLGHAAFSSSVNDLRQAEADPTLAGLDYTHWQISLARDFGHFGSFNLNYDQNDGGANEFVAYDNDAKFSVGWTKSF